MIAPDDLLAARIIHRQRPELHGELVQALAALASAESDDARTTRTLLGDLLAQQVITRDQAEYVHRLAERYKHGQALGLFVHLLEQQGLPADELRGLVAELGDGATAAALAERLVRAGRLDEELARRLQYQAKLAFDQDRAGQVSAYRKRASAETAQTLVAGGAADDDASSALAPALEDEIPTGVINNELVMPSSAEATGIIDRASLSLSMESLAPRFPVPDWVDASDPLVGKLIGGYRVLGKVGAGAMATVYLADHHQREGPVALKLLPRGASNERRERFKREILANSFFSHERVIDVYDAGVDGQQFLAMEFFDGTDLEHVLETEGTLSLRQSLSIIRQVLEALGAAHAAGIVHRDIKPSNILVSEGGHIAKLMDFGIALIKDLGEFKSKVFESDDGGVTGTPEYLSPEQAFRDPVGPPSDLYSTGLVLYRMLSGRLPFDSQTVSGWISQHIAEEPLPLERAAPDGQWPPALLDLLRDLFVKDPKQRIASAQDVLTRLDAIALDIGSGRKSRLFGRLRRGF